MTFSRSLSFFLALTLLVAVMSALHGCGGGGNSSGSSLVYTTDWTNRGNNISGQSQRIRIFDDAGRLLQTLTLNQDSDGLQQLALTGVGSGTRRISIELFSGRDLGGTKTGEIDAWIEVSGSTTFRTGVGDGITQIKVTPPAATISVQQSKQFFATAYSSATTATFVAPNSFQWQVLGGIATVSQQGLVLGTSAGQGSVRATHTPSGLQGAATLTVNPFNATTSKWTVMVFLNAANDLSQFSLLNFNQMERVAGNPNNVRFVVQWKQAPELGYTTFFSGTRRYLVKHDNTSQIASELVQEMGNNVDMGSPQTLTDFVQWAKTFYPAERYVLVVWNHGNGWKRGLQMDYPTRAVSYDDQTGNAIQTWQLAQAIGSPVDIVAWDASLMQMLEVAYEIKDVAEYVVGSEESPPGEGYPYDLIFDDFRDRPDDSTRALTKAFVDGMLAVPAYASRKITQSSLETAKLGALASSVDILAAELIANKDQLESVVQTVRSPLVTQAYSPSSGRVYRDLYHLCENIEARTSIPSVLAACIAVRAAVVDAVAWEGNNNNSPNSHGVSIDFSSSSDFFAGGQAADYALLRLAQATRWNEWLQVAP